MKKTTFATTVQYLLLITAQFVTAKNTTKTFCSGDNCYPRHDDLANSRAKFYEPGGELSAASQLRAKRGAYRRRPNHSNIWKDRVYYYLDSTITDPVLVDNFRRAVRDWEDNTCIDFVEVSSPYGIKDVIRVTAEQNICYSYLGRVGGEQPLILGRGCELYGVIAHEIGHSLGLFHTMSRHDRDKYITPTIGNLPLEFQNELNKKTEMENDNYGIPYDYGSIMHYPRRHEVTWYRPLMKPTDPKYGFTMGSHMIAFSDFSMINEHYQCKEICARFPDTITCKNGGFPIPRDCSRCICPGGYGGDDCSQRPNDGCGRELQATKNWTELVLRFSNPYPTYYNDYYRRCTYWVKSPNNTRIQVKFYAVHFEVKRDGCVLAGVEIKSNRNQTLTGYRRCSNVKKNFKDIFTSFTNLVPVITYTNDRRPSIANISFRYLEDGENENDL